MSRLSELILVINDDENIKRYKELEKRVDEDQNLMAEYIKLKDLQKILVQNEAKKSSNLEQSKKQYQDHLVVF